MHKYVLVVFGSYGVKQFFTQKQVVTDPSARLKVLGVSATRQMHSNTPILAILTGDGRKLTLLLIHTVPN